MKKIREKDVLQSGRNGLNHSILTAKQFFPGFKKIFLLYFSNLKT